MIERNEAAVNATTWTNHNIMVRNQSQRTTYVLPFQKRESIKTKQIKSFQKGRQMGGPKAVTSNGS